MNTKASRKLEGQKTLLGRTMHSIVYNERRDEFTVPQPFAQALLTFRGAANGEESPIRVIQGPKTQLVEPDRLALDEINDELWVPMDTVKRITVYRASANGDVAPLRSIEGPDTTIGAEAIAIDNVHNLMVAAGVGKEGLRLDRKSTRLNSSH